MINQIRGKLTVIVDYRTLLLKKSVKKLKFVSENRLKTFYHGTKVVYTESSCH